MSEKNYQNNDIKHLLMAMAICSAIALFGVFLVKPPSLIAVFSFIFILPIICLILFISTIAFAFQNKAKESAIALVCCIWLPISFVGFMILLPYFGLIGHTYSDGTDLDERIVVALKENTSRRYSIKFYESIPNKTVSTSNRTYIEYEEGVCFVQQLYDEFKYKLLDIGFCNDATDEQKRAIRAKVNSSNMVHKVFQNLRKEDIKNLPLEKAKVEPKGNVKDAKTAVNVEGSN